VGHSDDGGTDVLHTRRDEKQQYHKHGRNRQSKAFGYRDNKFFGLALSGLKQSRIITTEDGPVAWLMPDISQTQVLIEQTAKMIREMKGQKQ